MGKINWKKRYIVVFGHRRMGLVRMYFALPQMADRQCHLLPQILNLLSCSSPVTLNAYIRGRVNEENKDSCKGGKRL